MRGWFAYELYDRMAKDARIWVVTADLGYGMLDAIKSQYPSRFINTGAAEQAAMGIAVGLAETGKIPFFYSITPFALYRPAEIIRNYIDHEDIAVRIVGGGRDRDYSHDGFSHWADDAASFLALFPNITQYWPKDKESIPRMVDAMVTRNEPSFISLKR